MHTLTRGVIAGATGTVALNAATYTDMLVRARPASSVPAEVANELADRADVSLGEERTRTNRTQGAGALLGYVTGLGIGIGYSLAPRMMKNLPVWATGPVLGVAAMAGSDVPATVVGATDPKKWGVNAWLSDIIPHMVYGVTTAAVYRMLDR
ncbi:MAG TPA: hypothetical protein VFZ37_13740 [Jiangellaceae bacterium]